MLPLAAAAAGPDPALHQAAALVPAQVPPADPAPLVPAALVLQALVPPLPAPQAPRALAEDAMTTAADPAQRESFHLIQLYNIYTLCIFTCLSHDEGNQCFVCDSAGPKHRRGEMIKNEGKEAQAPNQLKFT